MQESYDWSRYWAGEKPGSPAPEARLKRVLMTGASGFLGAAALKELCRRKHFRVRALIHQRQPLDAGAELVSGDLTRPKTLTSAVTDIDAVLHFASHIGEDEEACQAVNARGTEALTRAGMAAGVSRFIYVSNASVCGWAVHCGETEDAVRVAPATPVSRSRADAERAVLAASGIVLRPLFVYGVGDTRFVPTLDRALQRFRFLIDHGRARVSLIEVDDLARVVCDLLELDTPLSGVLHVNDGHPTSVAEIVNLMSRHLRTPNPRYSVPWPIARRIVRLFGARGVGNWAGIDSAEHRAFLVSRDHYFDSSRLWQTLGQVCPPAISAQFSKSQDWYQELFRVANQGNAR